MEKNKTHTMKMQYVLLACMIVAFIAIITVILLKTNGIFDKKKDIGGAPVIEDVFLSDTEAKTVTFSTAGYSAKISYDSCFILSELKSVNSKGKYTANILQSDRGIYVGAQLKDNESAHASYMLSGDPEIEINEEEKSVKAKFELEGMIYTVSVKFTSEKIELVCDREFTNEITLIDQAFPSVSLEQSYIQNIRWLRSGGNFSVNGRIDSMRNYLSAGSGYAAVAKDTGSNLGNIRRAMEDITFVLYSDNKERSAMGFYGETVKTDSMKDCAVEYATQVQRYESEGSIPLEMNVILYSGSKTLRYNGNDDGWGSYEGRCVSQGAVVYKSVKFEAGYKDSIRFEIRPADYEEYFDLGTLNGVNEELLAEALNTYARMMIMDHDMGTAVENPNHFFEVPALEQHWNTNLLSVLGDDAAILTQMNGMRVIRDELQASDGHIIGPYPQVSYDSWGSSYSDMMPCYVISTVSLYSITGDRAFLDEMVESLDKAMTAQQKKYIKGNVYLCRNLVTDKKLNPNDYWEHTSGMYNGYTTALYYKALMNMADIKRNVYEDDDKASYYEDLAQKVKKDYNEKMWSDETNTFLYGTDSKDILHLPTQAAAIDSGIADASRVKLIVEAIERNDNVYDLSYHMMNVVDLIRGDIPADQSYDHTKSLLGMNGGWYGAPDGQFYAGFPVYGDRSLICRYINGLTTYYDKTGFVGATCYMRDGVTPADYGWYDCMPTQTYPIYSLYAYAYGFQVQTTCLNIEPFIDESMIGSVVSYRYRYQDIQVTYNSLYSYTVSMSEMPADIYVRYINQTPGKSYTVKINGNDTSVVCGEDGCVSVKLSSAGDTTVELTDPDSEITADRGDNIAKGKSVAPSSTRYGNDSIEYWSSNLTDGSFEKAWSCLETAKDSDKQWLRIALGRRYDASLLKCYVQQGGTYYYSIEGTNDPTFTTWDTLVDNSKKGTQADSGNPIEVSLEGKGSYSYLRITFHKGGTSVRVTELEVIY